MEQIVKLLVQAFKRGNKVLICGNGGSSTMASHFAGELVGQFKYQRRALPAIALNDSGIITAIGNDYGFSNIFSRQVEAYGKKGDVLIILSTSGKSVNCLVTKALAEDMEIHVIDWPRDKGKDTAEIQEYQLKLIHKVCEQVEKEFI